MGARQMQFSLVMFLVVSVACDGSIVQSSANGRGELTPGPPLSTVHPPSEEECPYCTAPDPSQESAIRASILDIEGACGHLAATLTHYLDNGRLLIGDDQSIWGAYWPGPDVIEITDTTINDAEELMKTLRHEARHAQGFMDENDAIFAETNCPPPPQPH